jgi:hypothetical protein
MVLLGFANAGTENTEKVGTGDTSGWDRGVNLGGRGEWLSGWDWGGAAGACFFCWWSVGKSCMTLWAYRFNVEASTTEENLPLGPSGLAARLPGNWVPAMGLAARDPCGVPLREVAEGGFSFSLLVLPLSLSSPPDPAPTSPSLPDPEPPSGTFRMRFLPAWRN